MHPAFYPSETKPLKSEPDDMAKSVGIIGGGVAGLQTAKALIRHGFKPTVFEKAPDVGGVWRSNYKGFGVQVPKQLYEFPDFPMAGVKRGAYPSGAQVEEYIKAFVADAKLDAVIQRNTAVQSVEKSAKGDWTFGLEGGKQQTFDLCVLASGLYTKPKPAPKFQGQDEFQAAGGRIVHTSELQDGPAHDKNDSVVVLGGGKSSNDVAWEAMKVCTRPPVIVQRAAHWGTPRYIAGLIPFQYVFLSRFGQFLVEAHVGSWPDRGNDFGPTVLTKPVFRLVEAIFATQLGYHGENRPKTDVVEDFYGGAQVTDPEFSAALRQGRIKMRTQVIKKLAKNEVHLEDGTVLPCNVLALATGFKLDMGMLSDKLRKQIGAEDDGVWLYRHMLAPSVDGFALVGGAATISNIATHHLQAEWIARAWSGKFKLPLAESMRVNVDRMRGWKREWMPQASGARANHVLLHQIHYHDSLYEDMGMSSSRKGGLAEYLMPYESKDLKVD